MKNRWNEQGSIARYGSRQDSQGTLLSNAIRKVLADQQRTSSGIGEYVKRHGGRYGQELPGKRTTRLQDGTVIETWVNPYGLAPTLKSRVTVPPYLPEDEEVPEEEYIGFIFAPTSSSALYSWGVPYESGGVLINPPLGTVLTSGQQLDATNKHYRRVSAETGSWVVTHNQSALGGRLWKRTAGKIISWGPVAGWEDVAPEGMKSGPIYYLGNLLTSYPDGATSATRNILAANFIGNTLFVLAYQPATTNLYIAKRTIDWDTASGTGSWTEGAAFALPAGYGTAANLLDMYRFGVADINNSCNEAVILGWKTDATYSRVVAEIKITWDGSLSATTSVTSTSVDTIDEPNGSYDETFTNTLNSTSPLPFTPDEDGENYFITCEELPEYSATNIRYEVDWIGICEGVLSAKYIEDSDTLTRLTVLWKAVYNGFQSTSSTTTWEDIADEGVWHITNKTENTSNDYKKETTATVLLDGETQAEYLIYQNRTTWSESSSKSYEYDSGGVTATGTATGYGVDNEEVWKLAIHRGLADARFGGFVCWRARIDLNRGVSTSSTTGYEDDGDGCTPISSTGYTDESSDDQIFEYYWQNSSDTDETDSYTYTGDATFVSVSGRDYLWATLPSKFPLGLWDIMLQVGQMGTQATNAMAQSAAIWAPGLALVQQWVKPEPGGVAYVSLPYWNGGDLLSLASVTGDNQAISPRWGTGISGSISGMGIIG